MLKKDNQFKFLKDNFQFEKDTLTDPPRKPDSIKLSFYFLVMLSLLFFLISLYYLVSAMPQSDNFFSRLFNAKLNYTWKINKLAEFAKYNLLLLFVSIISILFNLQRLKRKTDSFDYFNVVTALYAMFGMIFYFAMT